MADLKSFINTSSDRIKSAMGVPVDRIKTIQGSLLNPSPPLDDYITFEGESENITFENELEYITFEGE